jgi:hypothetical protein
LGEALAGGFRSVRVFRTAGDHHHHSLPDPVDTSIVDTAMMCRA